MCDVTGISGMGAITLDDRPFGFPFDRETDIRNITTLKYVIHRNQKLDRILYSKVITYAKLMSLIHAFNRSVSSQKIKILFNPNNATERLKKYIETGKPVFNNKTI